MSQERETTVKTAYATLCAQAEGYRGLSAESRARLRQLEADLGDNPALARTLKDIHAFAGWLGEQRKSPEAQRALLDRAIEALPALKASLPDRVHSAAASLAATRPSICRYTGVPKQPYGSAVQAPRKTEASRKSETTRGGAMARHNLHALLAKPPAPPTAVALRGQATSAGRPRPKRVQPVKTMIGRPNAMTRRVEPLVADWDTTAAG